tara:strand:+ start:288 stop:482 length:195 start_codon:yes stop_codon:yes gene_type:complete
VRLVLGRDLVESLSQLWRGGEDMNHEYRIKRIRNIIKRYEESEQLMRDFVTAWELIKEQVEVEE